jgi:hypothetical protein
MPVGSFVGVPAFAPPAAAPAGAPPAEDPEVSGLEPAATVPSPPEVPRSWLLPVVPVVAPVEGSTVPPEPPAVVFPVEAAPEVPVLPEPWLAGAPPAGVLEPEAPEPAMMKSASQIRDGKG